MKVCKFCENYGNPVCVNKPSNAKCGYQPSGSLNSLPPNQNTSICKNNVARVKPPIGIMPRWAWNAMRKTDLRDAMTRYLEAGMQIPTEWCDEYNKLNNTERPKI